MTSSAGSFALPAALPLECGELLHRVVVAYETYGELRGDNGVLLLHGISRSHRATGPRSEGGMYEPDGWFRDVIGVGRALDPEVAYVVSANLLGSPFGSTSPLSGDLGGRPYRGRFPILTVADMARAVAALVKGIGVRRLRGAVGLSLGGMVALRLASLFPELVPAVAAIDAPAALPDSVRGRLGLTRQMLDSDAAFKKGEYEDPSHVAAAFKRVRLSGLRDLYGRDWLLRAYGSLEAAALALDAEANEFVRHFDANAYAVLCQAAAGCDLVHVIEDFSGRVLLVATSTDDFAPPSRVRESYHALTAMGADASYWEMQSEAGHRAHYVEAGRLNTPLREFLGRRS